MNIRQKVIKVVQTFNDVGVYKVESVLGVRFVGTNELDHY